VFCAANYSRSLGDTVSLLLGHRSISPNAVHPQGSGTTALHLAASLPRLDVVNLLLEQEGIDDTLKDAEGKTCIDVAKGKDVVRAIKGMLRLYAPKLQFTQGQNPESFSMLPTGRCSMPMFYRLRMSIHQMRSSLCYRRPGSDMLIYHI
jgi:ankyrin repeat protein